MRRSLSRIFGHKADTRRQSQQKRSVLHVERLEDRCVPATFNVLSTADTVGAVVQVAPGVFNAPSLRSAITAANSLAGPDTIRLAPGNYQITRTSTVADNTNDRGDFDIALTSTATKRDSLTIIGASNGGTNILGDPRSPYQGRERLFDVLGVGDVVFANLTLMNAGNTQSFGGAVQAISANITMRDTRVSGMFGLKGGAINAENGNVTLVRTTLIGNNAGTATTPGDGGAINATSGTVQLLDNSLVESNQAAGNGGGIAAGSGAVVMINSIVDHNFAGGSGGGVFDLHGAVALNHSSLTRNTASLSGGGLAAEGGAVQISNISNVEANTSVNGDGGGVYSFGGTAGVADSTVKGNTSKTSGGGIAATAAVLTRSTVSGNQATQGFGGGISANAVALNGTTVSGNTAGAEGGGICAGGNVTVLGSTVSGNVSTGPGGGISANFNTVTLTNSTVSGNRTASHGGGINADVMNVVNSTISGNSAAGGGGGLAGASATVTTSTVNGNTSGWIGGGIAVGDTTLTSSTVSGNTASTDGGGIHCFRVNLTNATVSGNSAGGGGGGIRANFGSIVSSTIVNNTAGDTGGGVLQVTDNGVNSDLHVKNTIIANNHIAGSFHNLHLYFPQDVSGAFISDGHNLIGAVDGSTGFGAAGDLLGTSSAPLDPKLGPLANNGGPTQTHALLAGSPAIDHGDNSGAPATDQRGVARPRDGDGNGSKIVDIGAFEL